MYPNLTTRCGKIEKIVRQTSSKLLVNLTNWKTEYLIAQLRTGFWQKLFRLKVYFKPRRKNPFLLFLPLTSEPVWLKIYHKSIHRHYGKQKIVLEGTGRYTQRNSCLKSMTSENSRICDTGCLNAKPDVLNCSSDLDFKLWVFWLSLVWSWIVEIYAWSTIWNYFDLT